MAEFEFLKAGTSQAQNQKAAAYLFEQSSTGKAATGVWAGLAVSQTTTASGSVNVAAGACNTQAATGDGVGMLVNDTDPKALDVLIANPVGGLPRNDIIVFDRATGSIRAIIGTPNASPTDPTVPNSAAPLARIRNAASATTIPSSAIDDLRTFIGLTDSLAATPFADFSRGAGGNITRATWTKLAYTTQNNLEGGILYSSGDFTVPTDGLYECRGQNMFTGSAGMSVVGCLIAVDGATKEFAYAAGSAAGNWSAMAARTLRLNAGQKVSFSAYHDATAAIPTQSDPNATWCQVRRVGD